MSLISASCIAANAASREHIKLIVGTYTGKGSKGIYICDFDLLTGDCKIVDSVAASNPSYLTDGGNGFIYAVREDNLDSDAVVAFDGHECKLRFSGESLTNGKAPCYLVKDKHSGHVITANYGGGSISVFGLNEDGTLSGLEQTVSFEGSGPNKERQEAPHIHCALFSPDSKYLFATDLGTDRIYRFEVDRTPDKPFLSAGTKKDHTLPPGSGPRHMAFNPEGSVMYVITELSGEILSYRHANGELEHIQTIPADPSKAGGSAGIAVTPDGRFVYASHRLQNDGVSIFRVDTDGKLSAVGYLPTGVHPRDIAVTPDGKHLLAACRDDNKIEVYSINADTGDLTNLKKDIAVSMPVCLLFLDSQ